MTSYRSRERRSFSPLTRLPWLGRVLGAGPLPVAPHAFALTADRLSYAGFARDDGGFQFREQHHQELPEEGFHSGLLGGPLREPAAFAVSVKRLVDRVSLPVKEASLVVPDAWMRVAFTEMEELPRRTAAREEVLRWKLKRLVPFPVEEVRLDAMPVPPLPGSGGRSQQRMLLGFAIEQLLGQVEDAFSAAGVRLGRITNQSLAALAALASGGPGGNPAGRRGGAGGLIALVVVEDAGYALLVVRGDQPLLHRFKSLVAAPPGQGQMPASAESAGTGEQGDDIEAELAGLQRRLAAGGRELDRLVTRDLVLTRNFLAEQAPGVELDRALLLAPPEAESRWRDRLAEGLGVPVEPLGTQHLVPIAVAGASPAWREVAPLLGAVCEEVVH